ncbi:MAG: hypothetical protein FWC22_02880 [Treponema sp.]|nr:hypothetical protein [Treponema sp.]
MDEGTIRQEEVDNLLERESVKLKEYILNEITLMQYDNEGDEYFIKGIAALIKARKCKEDTKNSRRKQKKEKVN